MKKKYIILSILFLLIGFFAFNFINVKADSGWDSDYDSGWDSSSDWDSDWDSDWGSDYDSHHYDYDGYHYSSNYSGSDPELVFGFFVVIVAIIIIATVKKHGVNTEMTQGNSHFNKSISEDEIKKYIPNFNKEVFLTQAYNNFIAVQDAWSDFDYEQLRKLLSDELYNTYHSQLIALKSKRQKNIMTDFVKKNIDITDIYADETFISLKVSLTVAFYDYVVDENNKVVRGTKSFKLSNSYDLTFISTIDAQNNKKSKNCPSCGAPVADTASNVCTYCNATIVFENHDWVMSKKEIRRF